MRKKVYSVRGRIANTPIIRRECYSRKKVLTFLLTFHSAKDGTLKEYKYNIMVKDKLLNLKYKGKPYQVSMLDYLSNKLTKGDIVRLYGYNQKGVFYKGKPFLALRVIKFRILWSNRTLNEMIKNNISIYNTIYHSNENPLSNNQDIKTFIRKFRKENKHSAFISMLTKNPYSNYKRNRKRNDKGYIFLMSMNKSLAREKYLKGDKYSALATIGLNKYIYLNDLSEHATKSDQDITFIKSLITADFKENKPFIPMRH